MDKFRKIVALLLTVAILIVGLSLGLFNSEPVTFDYLAGRIELPLIALMVLSAAVAALLCGLISAIPLMRQRRRIARLQKELENLRQRENVAAKLPRFAKLVVFSGLGMAVLLLPLGLALGWHLHRVTRDAPESQPGTPVSSDYLEGLQHLADDDPDRAIAALTRAVAVDSQTIELHLTLGRLFRKRGEVDRAMRIHQHLLSRDSLPPSETNQVRLELARDYHEAGLLDRAEGLYSGLVDDGMYLEEALRALIAIFEQTQEWGQAEQAAQRLQSVEGHSQAKQIAHYCCEQANAARAAGDAQKAIDLLERALKVDGNCVRASIMLGEIHEKAGQYRQALRAYEHVPEQDLRFFPTVLPAIRRVYSASNNEEGYARYLRAAEKHYDSVQPALARLRLDVEAGKDVVDELVALCRHRPTWTGLRMLAELRADQDDLAQMVHEGLESALQSGPKFRCESCGLTPRMQFWQCPSCKQWASIRPVSDRL